jgi:hypothetical protein
MAPACGRALFNQRNADDATEWSSESRRRFFVPDVGPTVQELINGL